jgi:hypothetical protein
MANRDSIFKLQKNMAVASFSVGVLIALVCLFVIPPLGVIAESAIALVSEFLILAGSLLGIKASFDTKLHKFEGEMRRKYKVKEDIEEEEE